MSNPTGQTSVPRNCAGCGAPITESVFYWHGSPLATPYHYQCVPKPSSHCPNCARLQQALTAAEQRAEALAKEVENLRADYDNDLGQKQSLQVALTECRELFAKLGVEPRQDWLRWHEAATRAVERADAAEQLAQLVFEKAGRTFSQLEADNARLREALENVDKNHLNDDLHCGLCGSDDKLVQVNGIRYVDAHEQWCPIRGVRAALSPATTTEPNKRDRSDRQI